MAQMGDGKAADGGMDINKMKAMMEAMKANQPQGNEQEEEDSDDEVPVNV